MEKHRFNGETISTKRLGGLRIRLVASSRKQEFQKQLCHAVESAAYTTEVKCDRGNVECRLITTDEVSFNSLVQNLVELYGQCLESYQASTALEAANETKKRTNRYMKRHKKSRSQNGVPNYKLAAAKAGR